MQASMQSHPEPVLPNRRARQAVDMPVLPRQERIPTALQGYLEYESPNRTTSQVHNHRIHLVEAGPNTAHLPLHRGYVPR